MVDARGRPYFLWDDDLTIDMSRAHLVDPDPEVRAYFLGKLMRQARPDDVFTFVTLERRQHRPLEAAHIDHDRRCVATPHVTDVRRVV